MRVAIVVEVNWAVRYVESSVVALRQLGADVTVIGLREKGELQTRLQAAGIPSVALGYRSRLGCLLGVWPLWRMFRRGSFDVVHAHEVLPAFVAGLAALLANHPARLFHRHHGASRGMHRWLSWAAARVNRLVIAVSHSVAYFAESLDHAPRSKIRVAHNGSPSLTHPSHEQLATLRQQIGIPEDAAVVVCVARFRKEKGMESLLQAVPHLNSRLPKSPHLILVGSGPQEQALRTQADQIAPGQVHFVGHQNDVGIWYHMGDVVAVPSLAEGFGLAAIEAMSCARPIVASRVGGLPEVLEHGRNALLVEPGDPLEFADAIGSLLTSPERARELGDAARDRYSVRFTTEGMVRRWVACYQVVQR